MIVIDATNLILGRMATYAAKQALLGQDVRIVNVEKAVISGSRANVLSEKHAATLRGNPVKGPFLTRQPDRYVRRVVRGMIPYKQPKGAEAYKRVLCYKGLPPEFKDIKPLELKDCSASKLTTLKYVTVEETLKYI
jgi:large subunit ribosomal protein L13